MNNVLKWGLIIVGLYLLYRWWQGQQQTSAPAWTPGMTGAVFGGGTLNPPSTVGTQTGTYQPWSPMDPSQTIYGSGNPGYIGWSSVQPVPFTPINARLVARGGPVFSGPRDVAPVYAGSYLAQNLPPANPLDLGLGVLATPVGPTPSFGPQR